jgi:hypothetical protein
LYCQTYFFDILILSEDELPELESKRLRFTKCSRKDSSAFVKLINNPKVALTTQNIPHPYKQKDFFTWLRTHEIQFRKGTYVRLRFKTFQTCQNVTMFNFLRFGAYV